MKFKFVSVFLCSSCCIQFCMVFLVIPFNLRVLDRKGGNLDRGLKFIFPVFLLIGL